MLRDAGHERALLRYLRYEVRPYSARYRHVLQSTPVTRSDELPRLPLTTLEEVGEPGQLVLRPTKDTIRVAGGMGLRLQLLWATLWRREPRLARRVIDPIYKPVHWHWDAGVTVGYSAEDLERLGEVGRLRLQSAGVVADDVLVGVIGGGPPLALWQLALGTRRGGVPALLLDTAPSPRELSRLAPTTLAGTTAELTRVLEQCRAARVVLPGLRTLLVVGERLDGAARATLATAAAPAAVAVVSWWAPAGVRALWGECRSGPTFHLIPAVDHAELVDADTGTPVRGDGEGEIVWTPVGWKGTVVLRLRTGVLGRFAEGSCPSCGTTAPRLHVEAEHPAGRGAPARAASSRRVTGSRARRRA